MTTFAVTVAALGAGIPDGTAGALLTIGMDRADALAGLGALVVATLGVLVVRHLQAAGDVPLNPAASPDPRGDEIRKAA